MAKNEVVDIVFLIDATGDMKNCIEAVKNNIQAFCRDLINDQQSPVRNWDWRAKVVGYRDYEVDGQDWFVDNPFVRNYEDLKRQFAALKAHGGGDLPEDLLDALYLLATMGSTEQLHEDDPHKWRYYIHDATARIVYIFTEAPFHDKLHIPGVEGKDIEIVQKECMSNRLILSIFAPEEDEFYDLSLIRFASYMPISKDDSLESITKDIKSFFEPLRDLRYWSGPGFVDYAGTIIEP